MTDVDAVVSRFKSDGYIEVAAYNCGDDDSPWNGSKSDGVDENSQFYILFSYVGVHTASTAAEQIGSLQTWAEPHGSLLDWGVGEVTVR